MRLFLDSGEIRVGFADALATFVFLAYFFDQAAGDEVLQFFVGSQAKHFLATGDGIADFELFECALEQVIEGENPVFHENTDEFIGNMIGEAS
jgi:hypothetical protein